MTHGPLSDVRVIDLTHALAGPYCTMLLADLGADVIKVEPPGGDHTRSTGPFRADDHLRAFGGYFASVNRNKRSVIVDLKTEDGREALLALVADADILVENYKAGVLQRLGLGYDVLNRHNPALVYGTLRGFGDPALGESPYCDWPAFDVVAQAMGGFLSITGTLDGTPVKSGPGIGDLFPAALLAFGMTSAVLRARQTGQGQHVDIAMYDAVLSLCERIVHQHSFVGDVPRPQGTGHPLLCPFDVFRASDGWVCIAAPIDPQWRRLCELMERPEMAEDVRYATGVARVSNAPDVRAAITSWTSARSVAEVTAVLGGTVPVGPVQNVEQIFADPHVRAREMLVEVEQPGSALPVTLAGQPLKFSGTPNGPTRRAPLLGEHQDEIFGSSGTAPG